MVKLLLLTFAILAFFVILAAFTLHEHPILRALLGGVGVFFSIMFYQWRLSIIKQLKKP